jgi:hypothetical protein
LRGLRLVDAIGKRLGVQQPVAVTDGRKSGHIQIDATAKSLRFFNQFHSRGAEFHLPSCFFLRDNNNFTLAGQKK